MPDSSRVIKWHLNSGQVIRYSNVGLNNGPFEDQTDPHDLNTGLVRYSDSHYILTFYGQFFAIWGPTTKDGYPPHSSHASIPLPYLSANACARGF